MTAVRESLLKYPDAFLTLIGGDTYISLARFFIVLDNIDKYLDSKNDIIVSTTSDAGVYSILETLGAMFPEIDQTEVMAVVKKEYITSKDVFTHNLDIVSGYTDKIKKKIQQK